MSIPLIFYNIAVFFLYLPFGIFTLLTVKDETVRRQRLGFGFKSFKSSKSLWFHAASVGEVRSLSRIIEIVREKHPNTAIVISTMTSTGQTVAAKEIKPDFQFILPIENRIVFNRLIKQLNVKAVFITDTELWPNFISVVSGKVPLILLNGRISDKTFKTYKKLKFIFKPVLGMFNTIFAKSEMDGARFKAIAGDGTKVDVAGNIKFNFSAPIGIPAELEFLKGKRIALAASTHDPEESCFIELAKSLGDKFDHYIIAPRHIERVDDIINIAKHENIKYTVYSKRGDTQPGKVIIIDAFGLLEGLYQLADKAFIGGSLANIGGHNIFERLQYKKKAIVGFHMENFSDITPLATECNILITVKDCDELIKQFDTVDSDGEFEKFFAVLKKQYADNIKRIEGLIDNVLSL